jgi:HEAT repeat protein
MVNKNLEPDQRALIGRVVVRDLIPELAVLADRDDAAPDVLSSVAQSIGNIVLELRDSLTDRAREVIRSTISKIQKSKSAEARRAVIQTAGALVRIYNPEVGEESIQPIIAKREDMLSLLPLTPILFEGLRDSDVTVRRGALDVLYRLDSLLNKDRLVLLPEVRDAELKSLKPMTDSYLNNGEVFRKAVAEGDAATRLIGMQTLEELAQLTEAVRERLDLLGVKKVEKSEEPPPIFLDPFLNRMTADVVSNLTHPKYQVRLAALQVLESRGPRARPVAASVVARLSDENLFVRWAAARLLGRLTQPAVKGAVDGLAKLLSDEDLSVRMASANAIEALGVEGAEASPALLNVVNKGDAEFREAALRALGVVGPHANVAPLTVEKRAQLIVPAIAKELSNPDPRVRRAAASALGRFGAAAAQYAGKELNAALGDEDSEVRRSATEALLAK